MGEKITIEEKPSQVITEEMVEHLRGKLPKEMKNLYDKLVVHHNGLNSVISERAFEYYIKGEDPPPMKPSQRPRRPIPHPVHFREGMAIRNILRESGLCKGWDDHDYDNNWIEITERALKDPQS